MELKIDHVHIRCQDLEASVKWYEQVLGGKVLRRTEVPGMPIVRMDLGGQVFALSPKREEIEVEALNGKSKWGIWQIGFMVEDMDEAFRALKARGADFKGEPVEIRPSLKAAFINAPDGVEIEIMALK